MKKIRFGIIGCGKVTETFYLPVSKRLPWMDITSLVDTNEQQVTRLAKTFTIPFWSTNIYDIIDKVDAVVIALPNHLHASVSIDFLSRGIHTFVEKPMAVTVGECDRMIEAANHSNAILSIGLVRRYYPAFRFVKYLLNKNILGTIRKVDFSEGQKSKWGVVSDYRFKREKGGGVLSAIGSHTLDTLSWWIGEADSILYYDDSKGGVEANCRLDISMKNGTQGVVEISTNRNLRNSYRIIGEHGIIECGINPEGPLTITDMNKTYNIPVKNDLNLDQYTVVNAFYEQMEDFYKTIVRKDYHSIDGYEGKRAIEMIEVCHLNRKSISYPWQNLSKELLYA